MAYIIIFIRQKRIHKNLELNMREQGVASNQIREIKASERQVLLFFLMICQLLFVESLLYLLDQLVFSVYLPDSWWWRIDYISWNII